MLVEPQLQMVELEVQAEMVCFSYYTLKRALIFFVSPINYILVTLLPGGSASGSSKANGGTGASGGKGKRSRHHTS